MRYDFDRVPDRLGTNSYKWDGREREFPDRPDVIPMWVADTDFPCPREIEEAIARRAAHPIYGYTYFPDEISGLIAEWQLKRNGWRVDPSWITYTNGVIPALGMAVKAFAEEGDGVIIMSPVYYPFKSTIERNGRRVRECRMIYGSSRWEIDFGLLETLAKEPSTKLLALCSPHNPLSRVFDRWELEKIADVCLANDVRIMSDEIHSDLIFPGHKHIPIASLGEEVSRITLTSYAPSKTFNIAGLQMSAIICENEQMRKAFVDALGFDCIPSLFGTVGIEAAYRDGGRTDYLEQLTDYLWTNYELLDQSFREKMPRIKVLRPEATYLLWLDCRELRLDEEQLYDFFVNRAGVGIEMGTLFGGTSEGFVRMNIGCTKKTLQICIDRLYKEYVGIGE